MDNAKDPEYDPAAQYCGPGRATIAVDPASNYICFEHDKEYGQMGPLSYIFSSDADTRFIKKLWNNPTRSRGATAAMALFALKKAVMPIGLESFRKGMPKHYFPSMSKDEVKRIKLMGEIRRYGRWKRLNNIRSRIMSPAKIRKLSGSTSWVRSGRVNPIGAFGHLRPRTKFMPYRNPMAYGFRKRKSYSRYGRRFSKYRRYGSRRARFVRSVKKIAMVDEPIQAVVKRGFYGITGGVWGTGGDGIKIPNINRTAVWGRTFYGSRGMMNQLYQAASLPGDFDSGSSKRYVDMIRYTEKHTIQNTCLFPVVLTVYKHYVQPHLTRAITTASAYPSNHYSTAAAESAVYNAQGFSSDTVYDGTNYQMPGMANISHLWANNLLFNAPLPSWVTDGLNSYTCVTSTATLGTGNFCSDSTLSPGVIVRPFGLVKFKLPQMDTVKFYKKKTIILAPGQQYSVELKKRMRRLTFEEIGIPVGYTNATILTIDHEYFKGACGYTFEAHGLMTHDTTVTDSKLALSGVARSTFSVCGETIINCRFSNGDVINRDGGKYTSLYTVGDTVAAEGRAGVEMEETKLNN